MAKIDPHSPTWHALAAWIGARRERLVAELVSGTRNDERHRGAIALLDEVRELADPPAPPVVTTETDY